MDGTEEPMMMKRDALRRVTTPRERREALLDEFERSGLKGAEFARTAGINYQTFAGWLQQRRHARGDYAGQRRVGGAGGRQPGDAMRLVEAVLAAPVAGRPAMTPVPADSLEVLAPGGARMLVRNAAQIPLAAQLLRAIATPC
jgi:hypothetical protein